MLKFSQPPQFPQDESAHKNIVEWWYINGFLNSDNGERFSFMNCLFKVDNKRSKVPLLSHLPVKTVYFFHSIISNLNTGKKEVTVAPYCIISRDSFNNELLNIEFLTETKPILWGGFIAHSLVEYELFKYRFKTEFLNLDLQSCKPPLLAGGKGYLVMDNKSTYYYSLTDIIAQGIIKFKNHTYNVTGRAWMDHQWADTTYNHDRWNWFGLQLDNGMDIMCYQYIAKEKNFCHASILTADGKQDFTNNLIITPLKKKWKSKKSNNDYILKWKIEIPEKNIELEVESILSDQEVSFNAINYWEGAITIKAKVAGNSVGGSGFMELVGEYSPWGSLAFIKNTAWEVFDNIKKQ